MHIFFLSSLFFNTQKRKPDRKKIVETFHRFVFFFQSKNATENRDSLCLTVCCSSITIYDNAWFFCGTWKRFYFIKGSIS